MTQNFIVQEEGSGTRKTFETDMAERGMNLYRTFKVVYHRHKFLTGAMEAFIDFCFREAGFIEEVSAPEKSKAPK